MKFITSVKQCEGPGGTIERWALDNGLILSYSKHNSYYHISLNKKDSTYTKCIYDKLNHPYNEIFMTIEFFMSYSIRMEYKYFDKFIQLVDKLSIEDLEPDEFSG